MYDHQQFAVQKYKDQTAQKCNCACFVCENWAVTLREECRLGEFENRVLRRILGPKGYEAKGEWWRLHNNELYDLYCSPNTTWMIKSRRLRWAGHVACVGDRRYAYRVLVETSYRNNHLQDLDIVGRKMLKWVLKKWGGEAWIGLIWTEIVTVQRLTDVYKQMLHAVTQDYSINTESTVKGTNICCTCTQEDGGVEV